MSKDIVKCNNTINQSDIMDIYRPLHPTTTQYIFFPSSYEHSARQTTFWAIKHTLTNFLKIENIQCLLSHNGIRLKISNRKTDGKYQNTWRLNNTPLNNTWAKEEISREI